MRAATAIPVTAGPTQRRAPGCASRPAGQPSVPGRTGDGTASLLSRALLLRFVSIVGFVDQLLPPAFRRSPRRGFGRLHRRGGVGDRALTFTSVAGSSRHLARREIWRSRASSRSASSFSERRLSSWSSPPARLLIMAVSLRTRPGLRDHRCRRWRPDRLALPLERRGEGLAITGVVAGVPAMMALPLGVVLAGPDPAPAGFRDRRRGRCRSPWRPFRAFRAPPDFGRSERRIGFAIRCVDAPDDGVHGHGDGGRYRW